ncbi:hypothetical protein F4553_003154 [Allocatelliglobosispora scoriae]|uniref:Uncharacterized protein n=1 Tax=Allocatelliglobosispora scoriae TaxID=643052 RepID=A0A841BQ07_9ACTN|nr:DUF6232 family protein [Allocatelliglobosispora scoriae]MBB5869775.1 hypothetical protein [Allocatelliglobosispora scoriae]
MIVYYRDRHVEITSETLRLGDAAFRLPDLDYVWHAEGERDKAIRRRPLRRVAVAIALAMGGLLIAIGLIYLLALVIGEGATVGRVLLPLAVVVVLIGFAGPLVDKGMNVIDESHDRGSRVHEIWATIGGAEQLLLRVTDAQRFGQIYRALQRAIENHSSRTR